VRALTSFDGALWQRLVGAMDDASRTLDFLDPADLGQRSTWSVSECS
jgi:hypothetical protein